MLSAPTEPRAALATKLKQLKLERDVWRMQGAREHELAHERACCNGGKYRSRPREFDRERRGRLHRGRVGVAALKPVGKIQVRVSMIQLMRGGGGVKHSRVSFKCIGAEERDRAAV